MRKYFAILLLLALLIPLVFGGTFQVPAALAQDGESSTKISSLLGLQVKAKLHSTREAAPLEEGRVDILQAMQARGAEVTPLNKQRIFIHSNEELSQSQVDELEAMGLTLYLDSWIPPVGAHPTGFLIADMPIDKLQPLAERDYVIRLDTAEQFLEPHNDLAAQKINADDVWSANYTGANVTIAVLDSGLDVTHNDIPTPTASKDYSDYPTLDDTISNNVTGHGTHVTGSALGRGTQSSGIYKGTAPGADLVFLKIGNDTTGSASTAAMVNAIKAAVDNYTADIITISYGGWDSYHDGTSQIAQAVDYAVSQGAVVFVSAGNEATDDQHYSGNVSANSTSGYIQVNVTNAGTNDTALYFNLVWYDGTGTSNDLELEYYDSTPALLSDTTQGTQSESSRGTEAEWSYYNQWVPSGNSTWYLKVKNNSANSQFFHIYYYLGGSRVKFDNPDADYTISSPADADSAIAVGAYNTRQIWYDYANNSWWYPNDPVDQISTFSSRGPRVDTGAPPKPNIVAPGLAIISCRDDDVYPWPGGAGSRYIDNDGPNTSNATGGSNDGNGPADYYLMSGTSMATPLAAGVAALILEKYPTWTPAQVKQALESTAVDRGATGHDSVYGWGLIDALAAMTTDIPPAMETILESQGEYYNTAPTLSNFGFDDDVALDDGWYQMDSYTGNWTSLFTNIGSTSWDSDNWSISQSEFDALTEGSHTIYFKASDNATNVEGESGEWSWQFYKDITPPSDPTSVNSTSHTTSTWSSDNTVDITWTDATDNLSDLDGYSILWDTSTNTTPSANKTIEEGSENTTSLALADGNSHYFHIRSVDNAGNWQSTIHLGPFYIDTTPPTDPTSVNSTSHTTSVWSSDNTVDITWTDATDNLSDLDGYSILWDTSANTTPSANKTIEEGIGNVTSSELADGNSHYFHIRSKDNAGNWQSTVHLGPFFIDATPPTIEAIAESQGQYYNTAPPFSNFGFDDGVALDDGWYQMDSYSGNWTALFTNAADADVSDLAVAADNTTIYAVDKERNKIYKSTNAGVNWTELTNPSGATELQLAAVASDNASIAAIVADGNEVYATTDGGTTWASLSTVKEGAEASATALYDITISSGNGTPTVHYIAVAGIEAGPLANVWYYDLGAASPVWKETNSKAGFGATSANSRASAVAFSPNFWSDLAIVAITEEDDDSTGTDNVSFEIFSTTMEQWNTPFGTNYPVTIVSDDGITGLNSASISLAPDYLASWDILRIVFVGLTVAGDADAVATSGIYRLKDVTLQALGTGAKIHSIAYNGSNLVAGEYDTTDVWRSADPMAATPTVNVTDASDRPGGDNKVVVDWASSKVVAGTSGNLSAFAVSTDNGTSFSDILVITDTTWDNDGWTIPGFGALAGGSHIIYLKASDDVSNVEGESGEWSWQFYKGSPPAPPPAGGGGGGGGGGAAGVTPVLNVVTEKGRFTEDVTAKSDDRKAELYIPQNTIGLNRVGQLISSILMKVMEKEEAPATPADSEYIGQVYRLGPDGATFDPPIDLTIKYDQSKIPEGVAEQNLVVAMFDSTTGQWENLESTVDLENDAVTAKVSHFTAFAILARTSPASFTIADLSVTPSEVNIEESLTISVLVTNTGDLTGSYEVSLKIDDMVAQTKEVTLDGGDSETVSFSVTPDTAGEHTVNISDLLGTFEVKVPEAPAAFSTSALNISPAEVNIRESVTISVTVTNTGDLTGTHEVSLRIDKIVSQTKEVTLEGNSSEEVTFTITKDTAGTYAVEIDGLTGSFVIREEVPLVVKEEIPPTPALEPVPTPTPEPTPTPRPNWWLIGGIITGVVTAGLIYYFLIRKRITLKSIILRRK